MSDSAKSRLVLNTTRDIMQPKPIDDPIEDEINDDPGSYFLSPDSDDDWDPEDDDFEWDAGIQDFSLYTEQRKAGFTDKMREQWRGLEENQANLWLRHLGRTQSDIALKSHTKPPAEEDLPGLTPDHSPRLRDNLEMPSPAEEDSLPRFTVVITPPVEDQVDEALEDDDEPLYMRFREGLPVAERRLQRPGLRHSRTFSGKKHSWSTPGLHTVLEQPEAERREEMSTINVVMETENGDE